LVSGYLQVYARQDPVIDAECTFEIYTKNIPLDIASVVRELADRSSDIYAFSCYMWNMRSVRRVLVAMLAACPDARFILGGPQVMEHASEYVRPGETRVVVCNGEGEITFQRYLRQMIAEPADLSLVPGITFWSVDRFVTTERAPRIKDLDEIPSPFTEEIFPPARYTNAILETNRGCPFSCGFCFWGAATNDKVHKFASDRVKRDVRWISDHGFINIWIVDANWGIAPRDVELSRYLVECSKETGSPIMVYMAAAKNRPDRMAEITEILVRGGLMACQPISLQTVSEQSLKLIDRTNIKEVTYTGLQKVLRERDVSSYVELIWPLPGETLQSFGEGITRLCHSKADTIIVYPHLLLHNTPIYKNQELYGIRKRDVTNESGEAEVVVATHWVSEAECAEGLWLYYGMFALYNMRGLYLLANYLDASGKMTFARLFDEAGRFFARHDTNTVAAFMQNDMRALAHYDIMRSGHVAHIILHENRKEFDELLAEFVRGFEWWDDRLARSLFELDLLCRPYAYKEAVSFPAYEFTELDPHVSGEYEFIMRATGEASRFLDSIEPIGNPDMGGESSWIRITHDTGGKLPYLERRDMAQNAHYCHGIMFKMRHIGAKVSYVPPAADVNGVTSRRGGPRRSAQPDSCQSGPS